MRRISKARNGACRWVGWQVGFTLIEVLVVVAVLAIVALIGVPWLTCVFQKSHYTEALEDLRQGRAVVESYEAELGAWPPNLTAAFRDRPVPVGLVYTAGVPTSGYVLRTSDELARCADVRMAWLQCCGEEPRIVTWDEEPGLPAGTDGESDPDPEPLVVGG
jgi:prepilin-type N-terminal cleavage/methylation domain-containing protein